jgi:hypothetical protein
MNRSPESRAPSLLRLEDHEVFARIEPANTTARDRSRVFRVSPKRRPQGFGPFGRCSDAFGATSTQVRAGQPGEFAKPLSGMHQGTRSPLVSEAGFGRRFGSRFGRTIPADVGGGKALTFLPIIELNQALVPGAHNPLVPGSSPGGPTMKIMGLGDLWREAKGLESLGVGIAGPLWSPVPRLSPSTAKRRPSTPNERPVAIIDVDELVPTQFARPCLAVKSAKVSSSSRR